MSLPKKITPCPIIDACLGIRFTTDFPANAIFGIVFNAIKDDFKNVENLPILQLPGPLRQVDPSLKFQPHYKISNQKFVVQIGPDILSISSFPIYLGWMDFSDEIIRILDIISNLNILKNVLRIGYRVINFFHEDIYKNTKISIQLNDKLIDYSNTLLDGIADFLKKKKNIIDQIHENEKNTFYQLLIDDFLNKFNPEF
jgi:uncharacterized protein (TIGR04255 family)